MCLIFIAFKQHTDYPLIIAANRDEFYSRPTLPLHTWSSQPNLVAGQDCQLGGTWLGVNRAGQFAAVTNHRSGNPKPGIRSRGDIPLNFLCENISGLEYVQHLKNSSEDYDGYNAIFGDSNTLFYCGNRSESSGPLAPDFYGLSNGVLDTPWPKLVSGKSEFKGLVNNLSGSITDEIAEAFFGLLRNDQKASDSALPSTGVSLERERLLSSRFIESDNYGTRCSTLVFINRAGETRITERQWLEHANGESSDRSYQISEAETLRL